MRNWMTAAALGAATLGTLGAVGAQAQDAARPVPPPRPGGPMTMGDTDGDGIVTRDEAAAEADRRFAEQDADHDGKLTKEERHAFREQRRGIRHAPPPTGADGTPPPTGDRPDGRHHRAGKRGTETQAQFRDHALRMFDRVDTNHDGRIDAQEREAAWLLMRARRIGPNGDRNMPPPPPAAPAPTDAN